MKKNLFIVLSAMLTCIMLTVGIILSVCGVFKTDGERGNNSIHIHDYKDEWRTDGEFHWHECTAAGTICTAIFLRPSKQNRRLARRRETVLILFATAVISRFRMRTAKTKLLIKIAL